MYLGSARLAIGDGDGRGRPGARHPDPPGVPADRPRGPGLRQRVRRGVSIGSVRPGGAVRRARPPAGEGHRVLLRRVPPRAHAGLRPASAAGSGREAESELRSLLSSDGEPGIMEPFARCLLARVMAPARRPRGRAGAGGAGARRRHRVQRTPPRRTGRHRRGRDAAGSRGRSADLVELAEPAPGRRGRARPTTRSPPSSPATCSGPAWTGPGVGAAPEPWASGLRGDWRAAAAQWRQAGRAVRGGAGAAQRRRTRGILPRASSSCGRWARPARCGVVGAGRATG